MSDNYVTVKKLREIVDDGVVRLQLSNPTINSIVTVEFSINGIHYDAQFDDSNPGCYGFEIKNPYDVFFPEKEPEQS